MRHLILLLALFSAPTFLGAQCDINVNFLSSVCDEDATTFTVTFTVESSAEGSWFSPNLNLEGTFNDGEVYTSGPWPTSSIGSSFLIFGSNQDSCFVQATFPEVTCDDPCFNFWVQTEREQINCGPNGESILFISWFTESYPVTVDLLRQNGTVFSTDTLFQGSFLEQVVPNWEPLILRVTNGEGCVEEIQIDEPLFSCSAVSGRSWLDENQNGIRDDGEDTPVPATVLLYRANGNLYDSTRTVFNGTYRFDIFNKTRAFTWRSFLISNNCL